MSESILNRPIDTDGNPSRYVVIAVILGIVALIAGWMAIVEVQFMVFGKTIEAELKANGQVEYKDGNVTRLENFMEKKDIRKLGPVNIEILPGFGHARTPGSRRLTPFVVFVACIVAAGLLLLPALKQGRDYTEKSENRDEAQFDWKTADDV